MILISGPPIGKLCLRTRKWAYEALRRGSFGPVTEGPGGILYAELGAVERYCGQRFSAAQLDAAADGKPDRILTFSPETPEEVAYGTQG
jgi:hypothetical protein